jgi:hypothetical protein
LLYQQVDPEPAERIVRIDLDTAAHEALSFKGDAPDPEPGRELDQLDPEQRPPLHSRSNAASADHGTPSTSSMW